MICRYIAIIISIYRYNNSTKRYNNSIKRINIAIKRNYKESEMSLSGLRKIPRKMAFKSQRLCLKGNINFVCTHTANAAWFFPAINVLTSNVTQKCQRRISRLFVSGVLCFKYALRDMCYMRILIY